MYESDIGLLRCPNSGLPLHLLSVTLRDADGEVLEGILSSGERNYPISNGIPRFIADVSYNKSWDYKWRELDAGRGLNYRIIDKADPAYSIHDIFDRNDHGGLAFRRAAGGVALDLGCGVGQYSVKLAQECGPVKVVSVDLTGGVDIFRKIIVERYPALKNRIVIVQASVFELPFAPETFDFAMSLGVLMHTGETLKALDNVCRLVKPGGDINIWLYASEPLAYDAVENGRESALTIVNVHKFLKRWRWPLRQIHFFRKVNNETAVSVLRFLSSDLFYNATKKKNFGWLRKIFDGVDHQDFAYRLINNYDGWVNNWCDTWSEHEIFPTLQKNSIAILGMSSWRVGIWGRKIPGFYPSDRAT